MKQQEKFKRSSDTRVSDPMNMWNDADPAPKIGAKEESKCSEELVDYTEHELNYLGNILKDFLVKQSSMRLTAGAWTITNATKEEQNLIKNIDREAMDRTFRFAIDETMKQGKCLIRFLPMKSLSGQTKMSFKALRYQSHSENELKEMFQYTGDVIDPEVLIGTEQFSTETAVLSKGILAVRKDNQLKAINSTKMNAVLCRNGIDGEPVLKNVHKILETATYLFKEIVPEWDLSKTKAFVNEYFSTGNSDKLLKSLRKDRTFLLKGSDQKAGDSVGVTQAANKIPDLWKTMLDLLDFALHKSHQAVDDQGAPARGVNVHNFGEMKPMINREQLAEEERKNWANALTKLMRNYVCHLLNKVDSNLKIEISKSETEEMVRQMLLPTQGGSNADNK